MEAHTPRGRGYQIVYRALAWIVTAAYFGQAVFAGQFMAGTYAALRMHQIGATVTDVVLFLAVVVAALLRWRAKGAIWPFLAALALLLANQVQNGAGAARLLSVHVPLGVIMVSGAFVVAIWSSLPGRLDPPQRRSLDATDQWTSNTKA